MASGIASALLTRTNSIRRSQTFESRKNYPHSSSETTEAIQRTNISRKDFFQDENYHSILKCLDDGYHVCLDLLEYMQDYCDLLQAFAKSLTSYSAKWNAKLKDQSTLSSYHTTKQAQTRTVSSASKFAQLIQTRCEAIQQVIASYRRQVDQMYPGERFNTVHKHYQTDVMRKLFKTAHAYLSKASDKLDELREQEKKAKKVLLEAQIECQSLELNETTSQKKLSKANEHLEKKQSELQAIEEKITRAEDDYHREQRTYRQKAMEIYQQCRELEEERLNSIRETLISFIQAIHSTEYSTEQNAIYTKLLSTIESEQSTLVDLHFWAQTYQIDTLDRSISSETNESDENESSQTQSTTQKLNRSHNDETACLTTIDETTNQVIIETEEGQSMEDKPTTPAKDKQKKKKNNATEPTSSEYGQEQ